VQESPKKAPLCFYTRRAVQSPSPGNLRFWSSRNPYSPPSSKPRSRTSVLCPLLCQSRINIGKFSGFFANISQSRDQARKLPDPKPFSIQNLMSSAETTNNSIFSTLLASIGLYWQPKEASQALSPVMDEDVDLCSPESTTIVRSKDGAYQLGRVLGTGMPKNLVFQVAL
jgi:hypothetical protein